MSTARNGIILFFLERHIVLREELLDMICKFLKYNNIIMNDSNSVSSYVDEQWLYSDVEQWLYSNVTENMKPSTSNIRLTTTRSPLILQPGEYRHYKKFLQYLEWLDEIVDSRIVAVLKNKPASFWQPIHDYQQVNNEVTDALTELNTLRKDFALVSETIAYNIGVIKEAVMKKQQKTKLLKILYDVDSIRKAHLKAQMLINDKQYAEAIIFIREKQKEIKTTFKHVTSLRCHFKRLNDLKETVGKVMLTEFAELIQQEFSANRDYTEDFLQHENELTPVILGLLEVKEYKFLQVIYMEIAEAVIGIIRRVLKEMTINFGIDLRKFDPSMKNLPELLSAFKTNDWLTTLTSVSNGLHGFRTRLLAFQRFLEHLVILSGLEQETIYESSLPKDSNDDSGIDFSEYTLNSTLQSESFNSPSDTLINKITHVADFAHVIAQNRLCHLISVRAIQKSGKCTEV